jgi:hypothetical protein
MPCHMKVNYDDSGWQTNAAVAPQCAGRAIHWSNQFKRAYPQSNLLELPQDVATVFQWPDEFYAHHAVMNHRVIDKSRARI